MQGQQYLSKNGLIFLLILLDMVIPLSNDMYLPALPTMLTNFQTTTSILNFTIAGFFFFFAIGTLIFGPISDKYGRKPILLGGVIIYTIASIACALSSNVYLLILFRVFQAIGAGSLLAVSNAIVKDSFEFHERGSLLALIQIFSILAPMLAPILGGQILKYFSWRYIFGMLALFGIIALLVCLLFQESLLKEQKNEGNLGDLINSFLAIGKNRGFILFLNTISILQIPFMAYISLSSYIYITQFGLSPQQYSYYLSANTIFLAIGGGLYMKLHKYIKPVKLITTCFLLIALSGLLMYLYGKTSPLIFLFAFIPFVLTSSMMRPCNTNILLNQQEKDAGATSSLISVVFSFWGVVGLSLASCKWNNYINSLAVMLILCTIISFSLWVLLLKSKTKLKGLE